MTHEETGCTSNCRRNGCPEYVFVPSPHTPYGKIWSATAEGNEVACPRCGMIHEVSTDEMLTAAIARMTCEADECGITFNVYAENENE